MSLVESQQNIILDASQLSSITQLVQTCSPLQLAWASGFLAAKSSMEPLAANVLSGTASESAKAKTLTILFASQTGNAKGVAKKLSEQASAAGISVNLKNIADYKAKALKSESHVLIVASTNGEGEPPDDALAFHELLHSKKAPKLDHLAYSVLSLGDSSYEFFCQTGKDFDERFKALGGKQVLERVDCDLDYDDAVSAWTSSIIDTLKTELTQTSSAVASSSSAAQANTAASAQSQYDKQNPFSAELLVSQKLTGRDSAKNVSHVEIDLADSGLTYQPGDALGVWFDNSETLVDELLSALSLSATEEVSLKIAGNNTSLPLKQALIEQLEITQTAPSFISFWADNSKDEALQVIADDKANARDFAANHQIIDVVNQYPSKVEAQAFVDALRKITPRLYSIASSQLEVEEEVHLTVGLVNYDIDENERFGGASGYLTQRLEEGGNVKVFVEHNDNFRLPQNSETPIIMIGPGTGVAPFRAFMQEREANEATGDNWMFFGDQTFTQDFLYQVEWQNYLKSGLVTKLDVAFSRDQKEKIYVQDRIKENSADVYEWLQRGAHLYICGDANRMAKDVHDTLVEVVATQGNKTKEQAEEYLKELRVNKRYQKDVY